jgi:hypothetical protein
MPSAVDLAGSRNIGAAALGGEAALTARPLTFAGVVDRCSGRAGGRGNSGGGRVWADSSACSKIPKVFFSLAPSSLQDSCWWCSPACKPAKEPVGHHPNPFGLDGGGATCAAPFLEAPSRVRGSQRGMPSCGKLVSSNSKATRKLSLLCFALLWLKLLVALECSSLGGALHGLVFSGGLLGNTSSCSRVNVSMHDGAAPFDPGREGRVPLRRGRRMVFLCHLKLII